jgi:hypothetical protein
VLIACGVSHPQAAGDLGGIEHGDRVAKASEAGLHTSTSGCRCGSAPSFRKRRRSASAAHRHWVGLSPILVTARRQPRISGSSFSGAVASRELAMAANWATRSLTGTSGVIRWRAQPRSQLGELTPDLTGMLEIHDITLPAGRCTAVESGVHAIVAVATAARPGPNCGNG